MRNFAVCSHKRVCKHHGTSASVSVLLPRPTFRLEVSLQHVWKGTFCWWCGKARYLTIECTVFTDQIRHVRSAVPRSSGHRHAWLSIRWLRPTDSYVHRLHRNLILHLDHIKATSMTSHRWCHADDVMSVTSRGFLNIKLKVLEFRRKLTSSWIFCWRRVSDGCSAVAASTSLMI